MKKRDSSAIDVGPTSRVAMSVVRGILQAADAIGIPSDRLCEQAGLEDVEVHGVGQITGPQFVSLWAAAARSSDPSCGLRIGEKTRPSSAHIVGYLLMNCTTVGQAIERYTLYQRIVSDLLEVRLKRSGGYSYLTLQILDQTLKFSRPMVEW